MTPSDAQGALLGYLVSHPWHEGDPPVLDARLTALPASAVCWYLHDCAVAARAHGQGIAAALYEGALTAARASGLRRAALVAVGDAAGYWARLGYVPQDRPGLRAKLSVDGESARYMEREFTPLAGSSRP